MKNSKRFSDIGRKGISSGLVALVLVIIIAIVGLAGVWYLTGPGLVTTTITQNQSFTTTATQTQVVTTQVSTSTNQSTPNTVNLLIVPDFVGPGYDAFVLPNTANGTTYLPPSNSSLPAKLNNNVTVRAGAPIRFVITSIDSAVLQNFTGEVTVPFAFYNNTDSGQVAVQYGVGSTVDNLPIGHTFTISQLGLNIPLPPLTITTFSFTFTKPGIYSYVCLTPCGPGMDVYGYMNGYIIVTS